MKEPMTRRGFVGLSCGLAAAALANSLRPRRAMADEDGFSLYGYVDDENFDLSLDNYASVFCEGLLKLSNVAESEGVLVVKGNLECGNVGEFAGRVQWGLGGEPELGATFAAIGGSITQDDNNFFHTICCGADTQVGGSVMGPAMYTGDKSDTRWNYGVMQASDSGYTWYPDSLRDYSGLTGNTLVFPELAAKQAASQVRTGLGAQQALVCKVPNRKDIDYWSFKDDFIVPCSQLLARMPQTGTWAMGDPLAIKHHMVAWKMYVNSTDDLLVLTGDGKSDIQVWNVTWSAVRAAMANHNLSLYIENVPEDAQFVINVVDSGEIEMRPGYQFRINGTDRLCYIDEDYTDDAVKAFADACSRICWNFPNASKVTLPIATGIMDEGTDRFGQKPGDRAEDGNGGPAVLFPGTMLMPNATADIGADTNGHILIGGTGTSRINTWEHHSVPWRLQSYYFDRGYADLVKGVDAPWLPRPALE